MAGVCVKSRARPAGRSVSQPAWPPRQASSPPAHAPTPRRPHHLTCMARGSAAAEVLVPKASSSACANWRATASGERRVAPHSASGSSRHANMARPASTVAIHRPRAASVPGRLIGGCNTRTVSQVGGQQQEEAGGELSGRCCRARRPCWPTRAPQAVLTPQVACLQDGGGDEGADAQGRGPQRRAHHALHRQVDHAHRLDDRVSGRACTRGRQGGRAGEAGR